MKEHGGAETWANAKLGNFTQRVVEDGGIGSFVAKRFSSVRQQVSSAVQRCGFLRTRKLQEICAYRVHSGVQDRQAEEVHALLRGKRSKPPLDSLRNPKGLRVQIKQLHALRINIHLKSIVHQRLRQLEAKPVFLTRLELQYVGYPQNLVAPRNNASAETTSADPTPARSPVGDVERWPAEGGVSLGYLKWMIEREAVAAMIKENAGDLFFSAVSELASAFKLSLTGPRTLESDRADGLQQRSPHRFLSRKLVGSLSDNEDEGGSRSTSTSVR
jgi:hypothetical protein